MRLLRPREAATKLGVTVQTLRAMEKRGELHPVRTSGNHRRFHEEELKQLMGLRDIRTVATYARVSSHDQKRDLNQQVTLLRNKYPEAEHFTDTRSGIRFDRPGFNKMLKAIQEQRISTVVVTYQDRLARFGFDLLQKVFAGYGTEIEVLYGSEPQAPQEELVKDLISIVTSFAGKLYGLRSHRARRFINTVKEEINR
jgi:putative resolvase